MMAHNGIMDRSAARRVFVAGHQGMVGSALCRRLMQDTDHQVITAERGTLDLTRQKDVEDFFATQHIDEVYLAAAKVGGIHANSTYPAEFIYVNLMIEANVIHAAYQNNVKKLLFLGSSCIYPRAATQPMAENALLTGALEPTNEPYALAKIAGIKLCESYNRQYGCDFRSVMPTNLYGPNDNFHSENSHVIPALMRRFHEAKINRLPEVKVWGTGQPKREFLHVHDMADAAFFLMNLKYTDYILPNESKPSHVNIGSGIDCTIAELAEQMKETVGYRGRIVWDCGKPDGTPRKLMDVSHLQRLGWRPAITLSQGLQQTYNWFLQHQEELRK